MSAIAPTIHLSSSLRSTPPEVTLARARARARALGISRVTDITRLDRVGIPVYASIRPCAVPGSLCVNAGKGLRPIEAEVGAYMEAIEFALAEPGAAGVATVSATCRDVHDGRVRPEAILDFCPRQGTRVRVDAPLDCVEAEDIVTGKTALVPAELVFIPFRPSKRHASLFGATSNGLASGNTRLEATVHGLCEVLERDIKSFEAVQDTSVPVDLDTVEGPARALVETIREADLDLYVRTVRNAFGLAYFFAVINDRDSYAPHLLNGGFGCHPHRSVAFVRAVAEAAQSRLSFIHGGRDDLIDVQHRYRGWNAKRKRAFVESVVERAARGRPVPMHAVDDTSATMTSVETCEEMLLERLARLGFERVYRVVFTRPDDDLQVVRVIVPRAEMFTDSVPRLGVRLRDHASKAS
jgi:ribosomal protein S12 methylthiotransferase accessory factor